jgi:hypothetical protein
MITPMGMWLRGALFALGAAQAAACAGGQKAADQPASGGGAPGGSTATAAPTQDAGGDGGVEESNPAEPPFAKTPQEATMHIDAAVDAKQKEMHKCVDDARARRKDPHAKVVLEIGVDQEGKLIGVKLPKGVSDPALVDCTREALRAAVFPKSHFGVLTVRKTFEDETVYH